MDNIVTSLDVQQNQDNTTHVKYTVSFQGTNHICYGEFDATTSESTTAFAGSTTTDMWNGFKNLVLTRLKDEATNALTSTVSK
uniref:hypothetical protein n=1 Tax=Lentilactobacillus hilgardii TaxID=1588 RepID=UPI00403F5B63